MNLFKRIGLFIITNLMVMLTISIVWGLISAYILPDLNNQMATLLLYNAVLGMAGSFISLLTSRWMAKAAYRVQIIDETVTDSQLRWLVSTVHALARRAQLSKMPEVGVYESTDLNAFATGPSKSRSLVAVSSGLLQRMNQAEIEGVLAHEVSHIANGDMVTMTLIQGIVNTFAFFFSRILASAVSSAVEERVRPAVHFAITLIGDMAFTLLGSFVVAWFSRWREFRADHGAAQLSSRSNMIAALKKLQTVYDSPSLDEEAQEHTALAALRISNRSSGGLMALLMTHPPLEKRIEALQNASVSGV